MLAANFSQLTDIATNIGSIAATPVFMMKELLTTMRKIHHCAVVIHGLPQN